jgi:hypothetical protein
MLNLTQILSREVEGLPLQVGAEESMMVGVDLMAEGLFPVTLNIFFDLSICKIILNFIICLVEFCAGINMQMN